MQRHVGVRWNSDVARTHADEVTTVTRMELTRALRSLDAAAAEETLNDDVFSEDTVEVVDAYAFTEREPTLL